MVTRFVTPSSGRFRHARAEAFTLTEVLITVVIVGILSAIALPNYFNQVQRTRQSEAAAALAQLQNTLVAYVDENNTTASGCGAGEAPTSYRVLELNPNFQARCP